MPTLDGAVALAEGEHRPVLVGDELGLDVARPLHVTLEKHPVVSERSLGLAPGSLERFVELRRSTDDAHAAAAAPRGRLDDEREPDFLRLARRDDRHSRLARDALRRELVAPGAQGLRRRPDPGELRRLHRLGEVGALGEEAVAGMHRVGARPLRGADVLLGKEVARDLRRLVGRAGVQRALVVGGRDRDRLDPERSCGPEDAKGDLAAVGDEELAHHRKR